MDAVTLPVETVAVNVAGPHPIALPQNGFNRSLDCKRKASMHGIYLHGFGSGPLTAKGTALGQRLAGALATWSIPDLEGGDFTGLTMHGILDRAEAALRALPQDGAPVLLVGSSLGGYTAALLAAQGRAHRVGGILLIAPAFGFTTHWTTQLGTAGVEAWRRDGSRPFFHFGAQREVPLGIGFYESCLALPELPAQVATPVAIIHGRQDATVDHRASLTYARERERVELHLVNGDHRLTEPRHEELIAWAAHDLLAGMTAATLSRTGQDAVRL